jgi:tRNA(Ile)-lysidine synthase
MPISHLPKQFQQEIISDIPEHETIAVALSGGIDSMALVALCRKHLNNKMIALTVNHNLRKSATRETSKVSELMKKMRVEHHILDWQGGTKVKSNIEAKAREARYTLMFDFCKTHKIKYLLTAHNQNDQAETVLIRLFRGSGVDGLSAISQKTMRDDIYLIRPLLNFPKTTLQQYLEENKIAWVEDPSNQDLQFTRNKFRKILNEFASDEKALMVTRLAETAKRMQRARQTLENSTAIHFKNCAELSTKKCVLELESFNKLDEEIALRILSQILCTIGSKDYKPRFKNLYALYAAIKNGTLKKRTLWNCIVTPKKGDVIFTVEN